jgi:hypothetical protein
VRAVIEAVGEGEAGWIGRGGVSLDVLSTLVRSGDGRFKPAEETREKSQRELGIGAKGEEDGNGDGRRGLVFAVQRRRSSR